MSEIVDVLRLAFLDVEWEARDRLLVGVPENSSSGLRRPIKLLRSERRDPDLRFEMDLSDPGNTILYLGQRRFHHVMIRASAIDALKKLVGPELDYSGTKPPPGHA